MSNTRVVRYQGHWTNYLHVGSSLCADISPDGDKVASSATHGQVLVRERSSGTVLARMNGHWGSVGWIRWSADSDKIVSCCADWTARVWNPVSGAQISRLQHPELVSAAEFVDSGTAVLTACADGTVRLWDIASASIKASISMDIGALQAIAVHDDLIVASNGESIRLAQRDGTLLGQWNGAVGPAHRPRWARDGDRVLLPTETGLLIFRGRELVPEAGIITIPGHKIQAADWSPEDDALVLGLGSGELVLYDLIAQSETLRSPGHSAFLWDIRWHHPTDMILSIGVDGIVASWNVQLEELGRIGPFSRGISSAEWSPNADRIVTSSADGIFYIWDVERRRAVIEQAAHDSWIRSIRWDQKYERFLTASEDGTVGVWSPDYSNCLVTEVARIRPRVGAIWEGAWTPKGKIACVSDEGYLAIVEPDNPDSSLSILVEDGDWLRGLAWDRDDRYCVVASMGSWIEARQTSPPYDKKWRRNVGSPCFACSISPNGAVIAGALGDGTIVLYDSAGVEIARFQAHESEVWSVGFSSNGQRIVSGGADGTVRTWLTATQESLNTFSLTTSCLSARYSPSGLILFGSSGAWIVDPDLSDDRPGPISATLTDSPVAILDDASAADALHRSALVNEIGFFLHRTADQSTQVAERVGCSPDGFIVHLGGRWGSGKTTLMRQVVDSVALRPGKGTTPDPLQRLCRWVPVQFSAWSNAGLGPAWWALAMSLRTAHLEQLGNTRRVWFRWRELNWRHPSLILHLALVFVAALLGALIVLGCLRAQDSANATVAPGSSTIPNATVAPGSSTIPNATVAPGSSTISSPTPSTTVAPVDGPADAILESQSNIAANWVTILVASSAALGAAARITRTAHARWRWPQHGPQSVALETDSAFGDLPRQYVDWLRAELARDILLVVDDLDRCTSDYVHEVLISLHHMSRSSAAGRTSRTTSASNSFAVVVLADGDWLEHSVEKTFGAPDDDLVQSPGKRYGAAYLEKLFIASVRLPALLESQRLLMIKATGNGWSQSSAAPGARRHTSADLASRSSSSGKAPESSPSIATSEDVRRRFEDSSVGPRTNLDEMHTTIVARVEDLALLAAAENQLVEDYARLMDNTPRGVKRTLVGFWINRAIAQSLPVTPPISDEAVMRWTILCLRWPTMVSKLREMDAQSWTDHASGQLGRDSAAFQLVVAGLNIEHVSAAMLM